MIRTRGAFSGPSKASPQTLCQKCLKRGHYSYECKTTTQERPYASRPSRTQQLANPKLVPKLTSDIPNDLLRKKGIADEQLAKRQEERGRKRATEREDFHYGSHKRSRSSYSSTSVSTISTNLSRSPSLKRSKALSPSAYHTSQPSTQTQRPSERDIRKRRRSFSSTDSYSSDSSTQRRRKSRFNGDDRNQRRRRSSISPDIRGRDREYDDKRGSRRLRSRSYSRNRSRVARNRNSMTPALDSSHERNGRRPRLVRDNSSRYSNDNDRYGSNFGDRGRGARGGVAVQHPPVAAPPVRKERSLSPFSKRLALTQAMNMSR